jgi:hypothetical protein
MALCMFQLMEAGEKWSIGGTNVTVYEWAGESIYLNQPTLRQVVKRLHVLYLLNSLCSTHAQRRCSDRATDRRERCGPLLTLYVFQQMEAGERWSIAGRNVTVYDGVVGTLRQVVRRLHVLCLLNSLCSAHAQRRCSDRATDRSERCGPLLINFLLEMHQLDCSRPSFSYLTAF